MVLYEVLKRLPSCGLSHGPFPRFAGGAWPTAGAADAFLRGSVLIDVDDDDDEGATVAAEPFRSVAAGLTVVTPAGSCWTSAVLAGVGVGWSTPLAGGSAGVEDGVVAFVLCVDTWDSPNDPDAALC